MAIDVDHAIRHDQPLAAGGLCGKRGADSTAGNSNTSERTELLDRLRAAFPDMKIAALMGDREFIGDAWMAYLQHEKIPFILRLRENQHVLRAGYAAMPISVIAQHLKDLRRAVAQFKVVDLLASAKRRRSA